MNEKHVDVAVRTAIATSGGAEDIPVCGFGVPGSECPAQALPQLKAQASQLDCDVCGDVVPVELVDEVAAHHLGVHDPLLNKAREATPDPDL